MAYSLKAVSLSDAATLVAESLGQESSREAETQVPPRVRYGGLLREARYELIRALRDGAIEAEGEHIIASNDGFPRIEIRKVSRVWWAQAIVEPPRHINVWKPRHIYVMWSGDGALVIGPGCSPPPAGHVIDGATSVRRIRLEEETLLAIWPIADGRKPARGPEPGTTGFNAADKVLCPTIEEMLKTGKSRSVIAAARILVDEGKVPTGGGTPESRAARLARRFGEWKSATESG